MSHSCSLRGSNYLRMLRSRFQQAWGFARYQVFFDTTNFCNLRCTFCPRSGKSPVSMTTENVETVLKRIAYRADYLQLSCAWELSVAKNAAEVIQSVGSCHIPFTSIYSNGNILPPMMADALIEGAISEYVVSLGESTKETYESIRKGGNFEKVTANIGMLSSLKKKRNSLYPRICANLTLINSNIGELPGFVEMAAGLGIQEIRGRHLILNKGLDIMDEVISDYQSADRIILESRELARRSCIIFSVPLCREAAMPKNCMAPWRQLYISCTGDASVCPRIHTHVTIGNLLREDFRAMERGSRLRTLQREFLSGRYRNPVCGICQQGFETSSPIDQGF